MYQVKIWNGFVDMENFHEEVSVSRAWDSFRESTKVFAKHNLEYYELHQNYE
jgi:hypothetical protein